jgi:hypothetical protein
MIESGIVPGFELGESMAFWDNVERGVKIMGILGVVVAAVGVWITIEDLNKKEATKAIDEWQRSVVYDLIEKNPGIRFPNLSVRYVTEAQKLPNQIPRKQIDDEHLRLALLGLIQGNAIVVVGDTHGYFVKKEPDMVKSFALQADAMISLMKQSMALSNARDAKANDHMSMIAEIVRESSGKLTDSDVRTRLLKINRADAAFVNSDFSQMIELMIANGRISQDTDGKLYFGRQLH